MRSLEPAPRDAERFSYASALAIRFGRVGDLLVLTPALRALRAAEPAARIDLLTTATGSATLRRLEGLTTTHTLRWRRVPAPFNIELFLLIRRLRRSRYDAVFLFETATRYRRLAAALSAQRVFALSTRDAVAGRDDVLESDGHAAANFDAVIARAGVPHAGWRSELGILDDARFAATTLLAHAGVPDGAPFFAVHVGHHVRRRRHAPPPKSWPRDRWVATIRQIATHHGLPVVLTGSGEEESIIVPIIDALPSVPAVNVAGRTSLPVLAALLERACLLIAGDTGPAHIAAAVGTPLVALFGPSPPDRMGPLGDEARIRRLYPEPLASNETNRTGYHPRMWATTVDDVVRAADELIALQCSS